MLRTLFYGFVERANAIKTILDLFRPAARPTVLAKPRLAPPLLAKTELEMDHKLTLVTPQIFGSE